MFIEVRLSLELELPSGLTLRSRMSKEEYARLALYDGRKVSLHIRNYRILPSEHAPLPPELTVPPLILMAPAPVLLKIAREAVPLNVTLPPTVTVPVLTLNVAVPAV